MSEDYFPFNKYFGIPSQAARLKNAKPEVLFRFPNGTEFGTALHGFADSG